MSVPTTHNYSIPTSFSSMLLHFQPIQRWLTSWDLLNTLLSCIDIYSSLANLIAKYVSQAEDRLTRSAK